MNSKLPKKILVIVAFGQMALFSSNDGPVAVQGSFDPFPLPYTRLYRTSSCAEEARVELGYSMRKVSSSPQINSINSTPRALAAVVPLELHLSSVSAAPVFALDSAPSLSHSQGTPAATPAPSISVELPVAGAGREPPLPSPTTSTFLKFRDMIKGGMHSSEILSALSPAEQSTIVVLYGDLGSLTANFRMWQMVLNGDFG